MATAAAEPVKAATQFPWEPVVKGPYRWCTLDAGDQDGVVTQAYEVPNRGVLIRVISRAGVAMYFAPHARIIYQAGPNRGPAIGTS